MDKDDLVWEKLDEAYDDWNASIRTNETYRAVGNLILKYKPGSAELMHIAVKGGYNVIYRLEYKDGSSAIMRIPIKGIAKIFLDSYSLILKEGQALFRSLMRKPATR
jgi:hypothetical protein